MTTTKRSQHDHSTFDLTGGWCDECDCPVLVGRRSANGTRLIVPCPYCRRDHFHGRHGGSTECKYNGRRSSMTGWALMPWPTRCSEIW